MRRESSVRTGFVALVVLLSAYLTSCVVHAQEPSSTPEPGVVIVEWSTESEVNVAGFNLYRSGNQEGPFVKLNGALIPASLDPITGGSYVYTDTTAIVGVTYYYKLEDVDLDSSSTMHGPIQVVAQGDAGNRGVLDRRILGGAALAGVLVIAVLIVLKRKAFRGSASSS